MYTRNVNSHRSQRWERENDAPRLGIVAPTLESLRITLVEKRGQYAVQGTRRVHVVVVARASSHFEVPCGEDGCDGSHDLSGALAAPLRANRDNFVGKSECRGMMGNRACDRELLYSCDAVYAARPPRSAPR
jgi:hypothetical protein